MPHQLKGHWQAHIVIIKWMYYRKNPSIEIQLYLSLDLVCCVQPSLSQGVSWEPQISWEPPQHCRNQADIQPLTLKLLTNTCHPTRQTLAGTPRLSCCYRSFPATRLSHNQRETSTNTWLDMRTDFSVWMPYLSLRQDQALLENLHSLCPKGLHCIADVPQLRLKLNTGPFLFYIF